MRKLVAISALIFVTSCGGEETDGPAGIVGEFGPVCGSTTIIGVPEAKVTSSVSRQCGMAFPVRVHQVAGVTLQQKPLLNCKAARALENWVRNGAKPAATSIGEELVSVNVIADYACRTRNNQRGARISEHGKGNAIDVAGFGFASGNEISVLLDWGNGKKGDALRKIRHAACGPFNVVLGPGSDRFHNDHFHVDVSPQQRRYCK